MIKTILKKLESPSPSNDPTNNTIPNSAKLILAVGFLFAASFYASFQIGVT